MFFLGWGLTAGALAGLDALGGSHPVLEVIAVVLANLAATVLKFLLFRWWVFRPRGDAAADAAADAAEARLAGTPETVRPAEAAEPAELPAGRINLWVVQ